MKAVIMAGGKGTRLAEMMPDVPKPMVPIMGKPILQYQIENLKKYGITDIILIVGHLKNVIQDFFKDGSKYGVNIEYISETIPLGTAGALYYLKDRIEDEFLLLFGDIFLDMDFEKMIHFHHKKRSYITLLAHPNSHPFDSDLVVVNQESRVVDWSSKKSVRDVYLSNLVNAGIYVVSYEALKLVPKPQKLDFEKDVVLECINKGDPVYAYHSSEYIKDIGTPDRYLAAVEDIRRNIPKSRNLSQKQRCIFLDRDGTINCINGFINHPDQFEIYDGVAKAIKKINESRYLCIVVTNQPVVARGECSFEELKSIHNKMETLLGESGAYIDGLYYCPHHPDRGFRGERVELKKKCTCRKPEIGMLEQAAEEYNIDLKNSWMVGDTTIDIQTGINAQMHTALVLTGEAGKDEKYMAEPDIVMDNLEQIVDYIIGGEDYE